MLPDWLSGLGLLAGLGIVGPAFGWLWHAHRHPACPHWVERPTDAYCRWCGARVQPLPAVPDPAPEGPIINGPRGMRLEPED